MAPKPVARWIPRKMKGHELRKGRLVAPDGTVLANGITREHAKKSFPEYRIVSEGARTWDPIDFRLPGSYGSRQ